MTRYCLILCCAIVLLTGCKKDDDKEYPPLIALENTDGLTLNEAKIPIGGKLQFGVVATSSSAPLTNVRVTRIVDGKRVVMDDTGIYIDKQGLDTCYSFTKSSAEVEFWEFFVMNANRDSAIAYRTVYLGEGSAYGAINHYASLKIGMQDNTALPNFVDLDNGVLYTKTSVAGFEGDIDLVGFVYQTSGIMSPTLCCPAYSGTSSVIAHYPEIANWSVRNATSYDYYSSDNNLVDPVKFDAAGNDSLLVASFLPGNVSGLCKYCYTDKIIPFKTAKGKYGLVRVKHAGTVKDGYMELEIKIQQ